MLAVVGCACLFAQTCMLHFSAKHHTSNVSARSCFLSARVCFSLPLALVDTRLHSVSGNLDNLNQASPKEFRQEYSPSIRFRYILYSHDISVQAPYPYSVIDQLPDTRQSGSWRVSKSSTCTLDFEESDMLDGRLNGNSCPKSMRGKLQRGSVWAKWPTWRILHVLEASRSWQSIFLAPSAPLHRKCFILSSVAPFILAHDAALRVVTPTPFPVFAPAKRLTPSFRQFHR